MHIQVGQLGIFRQGFQLLSDVSFHIQQGEAWAITGSNGAGKTTLLEILSGRQFSPSVHFMGFGEKAHKNIAFVPEKHTFFNQSELYYQQRYHAGATEGLLTARDFLQQQAGIALSAKETEQQAAAFGIAHVLDKAIITLSNGETKKLLIAAALFSDPDFLLIDSPFTGLDAASKLSLAHLLEQLVQSGKTIIISGLFSDIPSAFTHLLALDNGKVLFCGNRREYQAKENKTKLPEGDLDISPDEKDLRFEFALKAVNVNVVYGEKYALQNVNWQVKKGERWSLSGHNGSGKSTLLSLFTADHPQAYANEIYLFDRRKGSGESIWDIKRRIGFVSPEMHQYYHFHTPSIDVVISGMYDSVELHRQPTEEQMAEAKRLLGLFGLGNIENTPFQRLSKGAQRSVLLARALVKKPPLLLLDEPCQGLDEQSAHIFRQLIDRLSPGTTIVYVTHNKEELPGSITKKIVLEAGKVVFCSE